MCCRIEYAYRFLSNTEKKLYYLKYTRILLKYNKLHTPLLDRITSAVYDSCSSISDRRWWKGSKIYNKRRWQTMAHSCKQHIHKCSLLQVGWWWLHAHATILSTVTYIRTSKDISSAAGDIVLLHTIQQQQQAAPYAAHWTRAALWRWDENCWWRLLTRDDMMLWSRAAIKQHVGMMMLLHRSMVETTSEVRTICRLAMCINVHDEPGDNTDYVDANAQQTPAPQNQHH